MELQKLTEHIWYMPFEEERDRPNLGYVKGDNYSIAIDAGHSAAHTKEFYDLLEKEKLPLPSRGEGLPFFALFTRPAHPFPHRADETLRPQGWSLLPRPQPLSGIASCSRGLRSGCLRSPPG